MGPQQLAVQAGEPAAVPAAPAGHLWTDRACAGPEQLLELLLLATHAPGDVRDQLPAFWGSQGEWISAARGNAVHLLGAPAYVALKMACT